MTSRAKSCLVNIDGLSRDDALALVEKHERDCTTCARTAKQLRAGLIPDDSSLRPRKVSP